MTKKRGVSAARRSPRLKEMWAYLQETDRLIRGWSEEAAQRKAETDKQIADMGKEIRELTAKTDKQIAETSKEIRELTAKTDKQIAETSKEIAETGREIRELTAKTDKQIAETSKEIAETGREIRELTAKTDKQIAETGREIRELTAKTDKQIAETDKQIKALNQHIGSLDNDIGALVEGMLTSNLFEKFHKLGYNFDDAIANCTIREKGSRRMLAELDMLMLNGTMALVIEVKTRMTIKDVDQHLNRMKLLHNNPNNLLSGKTLYGAMAGTKMTARSRAYAMKRGFFVLETSGDTVKIEMPVGKPAVW